MSHVIITCIFTQVRVPKVTNRLFFQNNRDDKIHQIFQILLMLNFERDVYINSPSQLFRGRITILKVSEDRSDLGGHSTLAP